MIINFGELAKLSYWKGFLNSNFWFSVERLGIRKIDYTVLIASVAVFVIGLGLVVFSKKKDNPISKNTFKSFGKVLIYLGIFEAIWFGLRFQNVYVFGSRFMGLLIFLSIVVWAYFVYRRIGKTYNIDLNNWRKEQIKQKYLQMQSK